MKTAGPARFDLTPTAGRGISVSIVEDDVDLREQLAESLGGWGFAVSAWGSAADLYLGLLDAGGASDLLVLDLGLPGESGVQALQRLRAHAVGAGMGVVVLTGEAGADIRMQVLLDGADAYLVKPISARVLAATLLSVHRRFANTSTPRQQPCWTLNSDGWMLHAPNGHAVALTAAERDLVQFLSAAPAKVFTREQIIRGMGHKSEYYLDHRLNMVVSRLRSKVRSQTGITLPLHTVRHRGLMWHPPA